MSTETYAIVFKGEIVEGFEAAAVQAQLAKLLKLDPAKAKALFSGKPIVLKKTADKAEAAKYGKALKKVGADVKLRIVKAEAPAEPAAPVFQKADAPVFHAADDAPPPVFQKAEPEAEPATATPAAAPASFEAAAPAAAEAAEAKEAVDTSRMSLAPNVGDLFDPEPAAAAPELDLSEYSVAENDGSLLVEPAEDVVVELDLSEFSVAENDGSDLFDAPEVETPDIDVPDFGLDEPGAVLETLQEEKEILNPNTMGMTLAMAGTDLLEDDEKPKGPPPQAPDTSASEAV